LRIIYFYFISRATSVDVILGSLNSITGTKLSSSQIIIHPAYSSTTLEHDIAVIKLESQVLVSKYNRSIDQSTDQSINQSMLQQKTKVSE
jgi:hypothetical protein